MPYSINLNLTAQEILNINRFATRTSDSTRSEFPQGLATATTHLKNFTNITTQVSNYTNFASQAKESLLILNTATQGLSEIQTQLDDLRSMAQVAKRTNLNSEQRSEWGEAFQTKLRELFLTSQNTLYKGVNLLDGHIQNQTYNIGPSVNDQITISIPDNTPNALDISALNIDSAFKATNALTALDEAIQIVNSNMLNLSATQTQLTQSLNQNNFRSIEVPNTEFYLSPVKLSQSHNYSVELQNHFYKPIMVSDGSSFNSELTIVSNGEPVQTNSILNPQTFLISLYEKSSLTPENKISTLSLKL